MLTVPDERKDIILDFSNSLFWGLTIILRNNAYTAFPKGSASNQQTTGCIMEFKVNKPLNAGNPLTSLPTVLRPPAFPYKLH